MNVRQIQQRKKYFSKLIWEKEKVYPQGMEVVSRTEGNIAFIPAEVVSAVFRVDPNAAIHVSHEILKHFRRSRCSLHPFPLETSFLPLPDRHGRKPDPNDHRIHLEKHGNVPIQSRFPSVCLVLPKKARI